MSHVIGLLGVKGCGKDTCARYLVDLHGYVRVSFAGKLYMEAADAFGVSVAFLENRDTKETPLPELALINCSDAAFVRCVCEELGWGYPPTPEQWRQPHSPRFVLQLWGTEYRRRRGVDSYWLDKVKAIIDEDPTQNYVVTDVRFNNEANFIEANGGVLVRIRRPVLEAKEAAERTKNGRAAHPSETELLTRPVYLEIENVEGQPDSLLLGIDKLMAEQREAETA